MDDGEKERWKDWIKEKGKKERLKNGIRNKNLRFTIDDLGIKEKKGKKKSGIRSKYVLTIYNIINKEILVKKSICAKI